MEKTDFGSYGQRKKQIRTPTYSPMNNCILSQFEKFALEQQRDLTHSRFAGQRWFQMPRDSKSLAIKPVDCKAIIKIFDCLSCLVRTRLNKGFKNMMAEKNRKKGLISYFLQLVVIHGKRRAVDNFYRHMIQTNNKKELASTINKICFSKLRFSLRMIQRVDSKIHSLGKVMVRRLKKGAERMNITLQSLLRNSLSFKPFKRNSELRNEEELSKFKRQKQLPRQFDMKLFLQIAKLSQFLNRKVLETYRTAWAALDSKWQANGLLISIQALNDELLKSSQKVNSRGLLCSNMTLAPWKSEAFVSDYEGSDHEMSKENDSSNSISG